MSQQAGGGAGDDTATGPAHPVADLATRRRHRLDDLTTSAVPVWSMTTTEKAQTLVDLAIAQAQLDALRLQVLAEADHDPDLPDLPDPGDRTVADWVARHTRQTRPAARAELKLARTLDSERPTLAAAMASGRVTAAQARAIVRALDLLPATGRFATTPDQRATAQTHLVDLAADFDATALEHLGRRIHAVVCPVPRRALHHPSGDVPADHTIPWAQGGPTDLTNARLLCGPHHRQPTHPHLRHQTTPEGRIRYHRRG